MEIESRGGFGFAVVTPAPLWRFPSARFGAFAPHESASPFHHTPNQTHRAAAIGKSPRHPLWRNGPDLPPVLSAHDGHNVAATGGATRHLRVHRCRHGARAPGLLCLHGLRLRRDRRGDLQSRRQMGRRHRGRRGIAVNIQDMISSVSSSLWRGQTAETVLLHFQRRGRVFLRDVSAKSDPTMTHVCNPLSAYSSNS